MRVLCVTAHADDMEIGCAGTLLRLQDQGHEIISLITVAPSQVIRDDRSKEIIQQELVASQQISKFKTIVFDTDMHSNGRPNLKFDNITMTALGDIMPGNIDLAILPNPEDFHQDHQNTFNLAFPLLQRRVKKIWSVHSWPYHYRYKQCPNLYRDISDYWDTKQQMLSCYSSYLKPQDIEQIKISNQFWAQQNNSKLYEAFTVIKDTE